MFSNENIFLITLITFNNFTNYEENLSRTRSLIFTTILTNHVITLLPIVKLIVIFLFLFINLLMHNIISLFHLQFNSYLLFNIK